ncbi:MAG: GtrA family protein [Bacteroidaceae bacterium]|nr:GtrA family protein [Bacteroidaceae bacterium]
MIGKIKALLSQKEMQQFIRFCIVGGTCALIDAAIFYVVRLFAPYQVALVSGYLISLCVNYLLTVYWTFRTESSVLNLVGIVGAHMFNLFVVRMGLMMLFVEILGLKDSIAYLPMAVISAITNYLVIRTVVKYSKKKAH